jgi:hypothetical protein
MAKDPREYGFEGEMVMSQLKGIMNHAKQLHDMLEPSTDLPEWVQSKVTLAYDYMQTAADYMATEMNEAIDKGLEDELMSQRQGQSGKNWRVTRANKTIGTYNSKDKADVKAMKHPLNKVVANEEVAHSVHVRTYDKQGEKQINSPEFKSHLKAHGGDHHYSSDKGVAFKFKQKSSAEAFHRGVQSKFRDLGSEHDVHEEIQINELSKDTMKSYVGKADARTMDRVIDDPKARRKAQNRTMGIEKAVKKIAEDGAVNAAGGGNVAGLGVGLQGEPGVHMKKKKKTVLARFKRFTKA